MVTLTLYDRKASVIDTYTFNEPTIGESLPNPNSRRVKNDLPMVSFSSLVALTFVDGYWRKLTEDETPDMTLEILSWELRVS